MYIKKTNVKNCLRSFCRIITINFYESLENKQKIISIILKIIFFITFFRNYNNFYH